MLKMKYIGDTESHLVDFRNLSSNIAQLSGDIPVKTTGFNMLKLDGSYLGDYSAYTTVYREIDGDVQFSNDGSVYVPPAPAPEPEPTPEPTLEEVKESKVAEMNAAQQSLIQMGIDVTLTDGSVEHFTLTDHDQTSLMGLQTKVEQGDEQIPWHTSDEAEHCKFYSNADMALITTAAMECVTWHVTYFRDLRIYIRSLETKDEVNAVVYGMDIPEEYQSEPLKAMIAQRGL